MCNCKDKIVTRKSVFCFSSPFLSTGTSEPKAPKEKHSLKIELNQVQAAARVNPTDSHSSKPEITWQLICNQVKLVICVLLQSAPWDSGTNICSMLRIVCNFVVFPQLAIQWWKGSCKREVRTGTLKLGSTGKLLCRINQYLIFCPVKLDLQQEIMLLFYHSSSKNLQHFSDLLMSLQLPLFLSGFLQLKLNVTKIGEM